MAKELFKVTDESLNVYGFRVLNAGIKLDKFKQNPVGYYNHKREMLPIGLWGELFERDGQMSSEIDFDEQDEFSLRIQQKVQKKIIRGASIGIKILSTSEDPKYLLPGQTRPTVVECELKEISVTDMPANEDCIRLYDDNGNLMNLSQDLDNEFLLQKLNQNENNMTVLLTEGAKLFGLSAEMPEEQLQSAILSKVQALHSENQTLKADIAAFEEKEKNAEKAKIAAFLAQAKADGKITDKTGATWRTLAESNFAAAEKAMQNVEKYTPVSGNLSQGATGGAFEGKKFEELSNAELNQLKETDPDGFKKLRDEFVKTQE